MCQPRYHCQKCASPTYPLIVLERVHGLSVDRGLGTGLGRTVYGLEVRGSKNASAIKSKTQSAEVVDEEPNHVGGPRIGIRLREI